MSPGYCHRGTIWEELIFDPKSDLPQEFSNRIGWEDMVQTVAEVYHDLPPEEREEAGIIAEWYGPAGAVDLLGPQYDLPHAVSGHLTYHMWGPGEYSWNSMIVISQNIYPYYNVFEECQQMAEIQNEYAMPNNTDLGVYICRTVKWPVADMWPYFKFYY